RLVHLLQRLENEADGVPVHRLQPGLDAVPVGRQDALLLEPLPPGQRATRGEHPPDRLRGEVTAGLLPQVAEVVVDERLDDAAARAAGPRAAGASAFFTSSISPARGGRPSGRGWPDWPPPGCPGAAPPAPVWK